MKVLLVLLMTTMLNAEIANDKMSHLMAGVGIYSGCLVVVSMLENKGYDLPYNKATLCLLPVGMAGLGKELYDTKNGNAEFADFAYTIAVPLGMSFIVYKW